jgi:hypothetical protein
MTDTNNFLDMLKKSKSMTTIAEPICNLKEVMLQEIDEVFKSKCQKTENVKDVKLNSVQYNFVDYFSDRLYDFYRELREEYSQYGFFENIDNNGFIEIFLENLSIYEKERYDQDEDVEADDK